MPVIRAGAIHMVSPQTRLNAFASPLFEWISAAVSMVQASAISSSWTDGGTLYQRSLSDVAVTGVLSRHQRAIIQYLAAAASSISLVVGLVTVYWFLVMRRSFRHRLIFFLVCGDLFRSLWFFIFAWVTISFGPVETQWKFCQATGFFVQTGNEISDIATLFMSIHVALLISKPWKNVFGDDGLYRFRHTVTAVIIGLPIVMASIAFAHNGYGYSAQLPICTLPVRPFGYRLALMWVPRYVFWLIVLGLAIYVYHFVGGEFRMFSAGVASSSTSAINLSRPNQVSQGTAIGDGSDLESSRPMEEANTLKSPSNTWPPARRRSTPFSSMTLAAVSEEVAPDEVGDPLQERDANCESGNTEMGKNQVDSRDFSPRPDGDFAGSRPSSSTISTLATLRTLVVRDGSSEKPEQQSLPYDISLPDLPKPTQVVIDSPNQPNKPSIAFSADLAAAKRRRAIVRQLRLLFIYPILYIILWLVPFVLHCYQYNDYYAAHPPFALALLAYFALAIMGAVNGIVFNFKERPWRHISGSDATFWGSFCWRNRTTTTERKAQSASQTVASAIASLTGGQKTGASENSTSIEADSCPYVQNQASTSGSAGGPEASGGAPPRPRINPGRTACPQKQRRSEAQRRQADQAYARLAVEMADRQSGHSIDASSISRELSSESSVTGARRMSYWWDRRFSGLSIDEDAEGEARTKDEPAVEHETMENAHGKRPSSATL